MEALGTYSQPFFAWLLGTTIIASIVVCLILAVQKLLGGRLGPRWCHALWLVLLIRMVLPWTPQSRVSIGNLIPQSVPQIRTEYAPAESASETFESPTVDKDKTEPTSVSASDTSQGSPQPVVAVRKPAPEQATRLKPGSLRAANLLPLVWLAGTMVLGVYVCANNFALLRIVRRERPLTDQNILDLLEDSKAEMGIRIVLGVVTTARVKTACLFGFVRPRLLLPAGMIETVSREELRYVFLHELAHLKRHDIYLGWLTSILQVLHWFNPLIWLAFYRMRVDRELACDALVLARTQAGESQDYGRTIVSLLERFSRPKPLPAMAGILETKAQLRRRITMIAQFKQNSYQWSPLAVALIIALGCVSLPDAKHTMASGISTAKSGPPGDVEQTGVVIRELKIDIWSNASFYLSRDGTKVVYWTAKDKKLNLVVRNLISGEDTEIRSHVTGNVASPVFSPDGKQIVYSGPRRILHIVSLQTREDHPLGYWGFATDWSRDGRFILLVTPRRFKEDTHSILSVEGEASEKVDLSLPSGTYDCRISPGTKYVSYSHKGNLYLYRIADKGVTQITKGTNEDSQPIWSPDGKMLVFLSRRSFGPELDLCAMPVVDGKAAGDVRIIKPDFGDSVKLYSLSETGRLLYKQTIKDRRIFSTAVDPQTGQPTGEVVELAAGSHPVWSPDGKRIAYVAKGALHVMSADGSKDQEIISVNFPDTGTYAWSADNDHIYIQELRERGFSTCAVSISNQERRAILPDNDKIHGPHLTCSPDGKWLAFMKRIPPSRINQLFIVGVDGKDLRQLTFNDAGRLYYPAWSPDGKQIAYEYGPGGGIKTLTVVSVDEGTTREVFRGETQQYRFWRKAWSPDGSKIAWESGAGISIGQVADGKYEAFEVGMDGPCMPHWSPDGRKMLFCIWVDDEQLMIMDNFLPAADQ